MKKYFAVLAISFPSFMLAQPSNDDCSGAIVVTPTAFGTSCSSPTIATTVGATASVPAPSCGATGADDDIWYSFTATSQSVIIRVTVAALVPSGTATVSFEIYNGTCGSLISLECNSGIFLGAGNKIINGLTIGNTYYLRFWNTSTTNDMNFNFCVQSVPAPPANDDCSGAIAISTQPFGSSCAASIAANTTGSTHSLPDPVCSINDSNDDIWYSFTANSQSIILRYSNGINTITGSTIQGLGYALYNGSCAGTTISCLSPISVLGNGFRIIDGLTIGDTYYLRLFSEGSNNYMSFNFCVQDVPPPPANNECSGAITIVTQPFGVSCAASVSANTTGSTHSTPDPSCGVADSNDDIWYSFTANSQSVILRYTNGVNTITGSVTQGLGFALYNGSCAGATTSCLSPVSVLGNGFRIIDGLTVGNTYYLRLFSDGVNNYMSFDFCIQDVPPPPANNECAGAITVTTQPFGVSCASAVSATTTGSTHSVPDPSCGVSDSNDDIWYRFTANSQSVILRYTNGVNTITGSINQGLGYALYNSSCPVSTATVSCLSGISVLGSGHQIIDGLTIGNTYYLRLFSDGVNNYMSFDFCIQDVPPPPANDECANAQPINLTLPGTFCTSTYAVNTIGATQSSPNPNCTTLSNNDDVWFSFTASASSVILRYSNGVVLTSNTTMTLAYAIYNAACPTTTITLACLNSFGANAGFSNITGLTPGNTYFLRLFTGGSNNYGTFNFCLQSPLQNDDCVNAIVVPVSNGFCNTPVLASLNGATTSSGFGTPTCATSLSRDVWFKATVPASGNLIVQTSAVKSTANNTAMVAFSGTCGALTQIACDDNGNPETGPSANHSQITLTGRTPGEVITYRVVAISTSSEEQFAICAWDETAAVLPPIAAAGNCTAGVSRLIDSTQGNIYMWVPFYNSSNEIVAEIFADGNNLGNVSIDAFINTGSVRQISDTFLLDRNISINATNNLPLRIRLYIKNSEIQTLYSADSTVSGAGSLNLYSNPNSCSAGFSSPVSVLSTTPGSYNGDYFLQSGTTSLSSFYASGKCKGLVTWNGNIDTDWHNPGNWDCGGVPWKYNSVLIPSSRPVYPIILSNAHIISLDAGPGASVTVAPGINLKLNGQ